VSAKRLQRKGAPLAKRSLELRLDGYADELRAELVSTAAELPL
jgi:hypothetical protein